MKVKRPNGESASTMQAIVIRQFGEPKVLEFAMMPIPKPQPEEVLVRIHAASVNPLDSKIRSGQLQILTGKKFPRILGCDFAGEVVSTSSSGSNFTPGTRVFAMLNGFKGGAYAEYVAVPTQWLAQTPEELSDEEAAATPVAARTAWKALQSLTDGYPRAVLINGASGGVGTFAVQIAKMLGATVTAVCRRDAFDFVEKLGAHHLIDYRETDFTQTQDRYDIVFDVAGNRSFFACMKVLKPGGEYVTTAPGIGSLLAQLFARPLTGKGCRMLDLRPDGADLTKISELITKGHLKAVVGRTFPMTEARAAHQYIQHDHPRGKVILHM